MEFSENSQMNAWLEDLLSMTKFDAEVSEEVAFGMIVRAAQSLGFEQCAYGLRLRLPLSNPKTLLLNNYPSQWQARYKEADYLSVDPTVLHGCRCEMPVIWSDEVFSGNPQMWNEARDAGLRVGWAQSSLDHYGVGGMLTLVRSSEPLSRIELMDKELKMRWLVQIAHLVMARAISRRLQPQAGEVTLTPREKEVLRWHADGKTADQISSILSISVPTVKMHTKNAALKLGASNKTSAAVKAFALGLLH